MAAPRTDELVLDHLARIRHDHPDSELRIDRMQRRLLAPDARFAVAVRLEELQVEVAAHAVVPLHDDRLVVDGVLVAGVDAQVAAVDVKLSRFVDRLPAGDGEDEPRPVFVAAPFPNVQRAFAAILRRRFLRQENVQPAEARDLDNLVPVADEPLHDVEVVRALVVEEAAGVLPLAMEPPHERRAVRLGELLERFDVDDLAEDIGGRRSP